MFIGKPLLFGRGLSTKRSVPRRWATNGARLAAANGKGQRADYLSLLINWAPRWVAECIIRQPQYHRGGDEGHRSHNGENNNPHAPNLPQSACLWPLPVRLLLQDDKTEKTSSPRYSFLRPMQQAVETKRLRLVRKNAKADSPNDKASTAG